MSSLALAETRGENNASSDIPHIEERRLGGHWKTMPKKVPHKTIFYMSMMSSMSKSSKLMGKGSMMSSMSKSSKWMGKGKWMGRKVDTPRPKPTPPTQPPSPIPTQPSTPTPITQPTTTAPTTTQPSSPAPTPIDDAIESAEELKEASFVSGGTRILNSGMEPSGGLLYEYSSDTIVNENGIITLNAIAALIETVTCSQVKGNSGEIRIHLKEDFGMTDPTELYPLNAVLVIDEEIFGPCERQTAERFDSDANEYKPVGDEFYEFTSRPPNATFDGFFFIVEQVGGSVKNATIVGSPTDYFAQFERGSITVREIDDPTSRNLFDIKVDGNSITVETRTYKTLMFEVVLEGTLTNLGTVNYFNATWSQEDGINVDISGTFQYKLRAGVSPVLKIGTKLAFKSFELFSIPIFGVTVPKTFQSAYDKFGKWLGWKKWSLPKLKVGIFFEQKIVWDVFIELQRKLGTLVDITYTSPAIKFAISMRYNLDESVIPQISHDTVQESDGDLSIEVEPPVFDPMLDLLIPDQLNIIGFIGVRTQVIAYATSILTARLSGDVGITLGAEVALREGEGFRAIEETDGTFGRVLTGDACSACHKAQMQVAKTVRNVGFFLVLNLDLSNSFLQKNFLIYTLFELTLPGNPSFSSILVTMCFWILAQFDTCDKVQDLDREGPCRGCDEIVECFKACEMTSTYGLCLAICPYTTNKPHGVDCRGMCYEINCDVACDNFLDCVAGYPLLSLESSTWICRQNNYIYDGCGDRLAANCGLVV